MRHSVKNRNGIIRLCFDCLRFIVGLCLPIVVFHPLLAPYAGQTSICVVPDVYLTIQAAVGDNTCILIDVGAGTHMANVNITRTVTIQGQGASNTIVDGNASGTVFSIQAGLVVTLTDMTITNGNGARGGGIYNYNSQLILNHVVISGNLAGDGLTFDTGGGGLYNYLGNVTINNSTIVSNTSREGDASDYDEGSKGGGIFTYFGAVTLNNSTVSHNRAGDGSSVSGGRGGFAGGIYALSATVRLNTSTVSYNSAGNGRSIGMSAAGGSGGGIYNSVGTLILTDSTVSHNQTGDGIGANAGHGAGILNGAGGTISASNSTISNNQTGGGPLGGGGGGIFSSSGGSITLSNSTISDNTATGTYYGGGGIYYLGQQYTSELSLSHTTITSNTGEPGAGLRVQQGNRPTTVYLQNSIVADNGGADCNNAGATYSSQGYNLDSDNSCGLTATGDITSTSPLLGPLADNGGHTFTHVLLAGSPAIDQIADSANGCAAGVSVDQRGAVRANGPNRGGSACDMGAYEFGSSETPTAIVLKSFKIERSPGLYDSALLLAFMFCTTIAILAYRRRCRRC
jgi:hypothetical protein